VDTVKRILEETGTEPGRIELEITESFATHDIGYTVDALHGLRGLGLRLAMDDFGIGYSCLRHLKHFLLDNLKIDRSFIREMAASRLDLAITRAIIAMAHSLGIRTIAEGVETRAQLAMLQAEKCDKIQGYLLSAPIGAEDLADWLRAAPRLIEDLLAASASPDSQGPQESPASAHPDRQALLTNPQTDLL
jgi:EAL domain-containing protein (putative c-di-GMP-specific phosphodiesterase class I)